MIPHYADSDDASSPKKLRRRTLASDVLPLPLWLTNTVFLLMFIFSCCYLLQQWREQLYSSERLHELLWRDLVAVCLGMGSFIYLINFFGVGFVQSAIEQSMLSEEEDAKERDEEDDDEEGEDEEEEEKDPKALLSRHTRNHPRNHPRGHYAPHPPEPWYKPEPIPTPATATPATTTPATANPATATPATITSVSSAPAPTAPKSCTFKLDSGSSSLQDVPLQDLPDDDIARAVARGAIPMHSLETQLGNTLRAAAVRRRAVEIKTGRSLAGLPLENYDYDAIRGACCEMVVGHVTIPVGVAGPLRLDDAEFFVPMATTEGCLVASTNRGCKAICAAGGARSVVLRDGMTRAPAVQLPSALRAAELKAFAENPRNWALLADAFNSSSRFARLQTLSVAVAGRNAFIRVESSTGDAMGMNMVSKGTGNVLGMLGAEFPDMRVVSMSGNYCADKKATAVNWIKGRGKSVVCEVTIPGPVVESVLKTTVAALVELNTTKNLVGSAMAGAVGGCNAHASNIVTAVFLATGQDLAQNVESSQCLTLLEAANGGADLHASVTLPAIEVGTVGGGTFLAPQAAALSLLGVKGSHSTQPGANAQQLARVVAAAVLAGELSLCSALASGHLVQAHLKYNRSTLNTSASASSVAAVAAADTAAAGAAGAASAASEGLCMSSPPPPRSPPPPPPPPPQIPPPPRSSNPFAAVSKFALAGVFLLGIGAGVSVDTVLNVEPSNVASREVIDRQTPNPDICLANGMSAMVLDQRLFISFNPFNVYVSQAEVKPGCVLRQSNWHVLESKGLVSSDEVRDCKRNMNTFGFVGDLRESPEVSCVYHSETAENLFLEDASKSKIRIGGSQ
ncbi:unnamed protein product [Closterium sp. Naga37s-1]|nr:unnamed protein product [Closterium sp. Naga37s-1]